MSGLKYRNEEWEALAVKWERLSEEDRTHFREQMTRPQSRRFDRLLERTVEGKRHFSNKMTTREDVVQMIALYIERNLVPMAQRIDALEHEVAVLKMPWHRRLRITVMVFVNWGLEWLDSKGIRLMKMEKA